MAKSNEKRTRSNDDAVGGSKKRRRENDVDVDPSEASVASSIDCIVSSLRTSDPIVRIPPSTEDARELNPISPVLLEDMIRPLPKHTFLSKCFRKKAVHISSGVASGRRRVRYIVENYMYGLDVRSVLRNTSSDNVFVWLNEKRRRKKTAANEKKEGNGGSMRKDVADGALIRSIELSDPDAAFALHSTSGHSTYCRAPAELEQPLVSALLRDTGMGCGQYDPTGERVAVLGRGEVEVFTGTEGHFTDWHTDFQENFTLQLSGVKKWTLRQGTVTHPLRGCTPHYAFPDAVESQLKSARLSHPSFTFGKADLDSNAFGDEAEVVMKPGDILYFPAGMWHSVETVEPGMSINVSLMATNYAALVCQSLQHLLVRREGWRESVVNNDTEPAAERLGGLLAELPKIMAEFVKGGGGAESILPPVLRHPPSFRAVVEGEADNEDKEDELENSNGEDIRDGSCSEGVENFEEEALSNGIVDSVTLDRSNEEIVNVDTFEGPDGWDGARPKDGSYRLVKNQLASLIKGRDTTEYYKKKAIVASSEKLEDSNDDGDIFLLNVNFAGNETHESMIRVVLKAGEESKSLQACAECEQQGSDPATVFNGEDGDSKLSPDPPCCLLFYGYFHWKKM